MEKKNAHTRTPLMDFLAGAPKTGYGEENVSIKTEKLERIFCLNLKSFDYTKFILAVLVNLVQKLGSKTEKSFTDTGEQFLDGHHFNK